MKILPVSFNLNSYNLGKRNSSTQVVEKLPIAQDAFVPNKASGVAFEGHIYKRLISKQGELKALAQGGFLRCIWCGKPMLHQNEMEYLVDKGRRLSKNSGDFTHFLMKIKDYLPLEYVKLVKYMSGYSAASPDIPFDALKMKILPQANAKLLHKQFFVFHKLQKLRKNLPVELHKDFDILIQNSKNRILEIPYESDYSAKEFCYKLSVLTKSVSSPVRKKKMVRFANILTHPTFKEPDSTFSKKFSSGLYRQLNLDPQKPENFISSNDRDWKQKVELLVIRELRKLAEKEEHAGIINLCETTKDKINGVPTLVQFSNKAFKYKLAEIIENLPDQKLKKNFETIADELPNSLDNMYAFIVKNKNANVVDFLRKMLKQSQVTLEHIVPILRNTSAEELRLQNLSLKNSEKIKRGVNNLGNWSLAHAYCNCMHGHENIRGDNFPFSRAAGVDYFRTLIQVANDGEISGSSVIQMAKNYFQETGIKINLKDLKPSPEY